MDVVHRLLDARAVKQMGIAADFDEGTIRWSFDRGVTQWVYQAPGADADDVAAAADAVHPPPPPPPPPVRTIVRQIPPTVEWTAESLHLLREVHDTLRWARDAIVTIGAAVHVDIPPPPAMVPFVPQPDPQVGGQRHGPDGGDGDDDGADDDIFGP